MRLLIIMLAPAAIKQQWFISIKLNKIKKPDYISLAFFNMIWIFYDPETPVSILVSKAARTAAGKLDNKV